MAQASSVLVDEKKLSALNELLPLLGRGPRRSRAAGEDGDILPHGLAAIAEERRRGRGIKLDQVKLDMLGKAKKV